jgi:hypothetical protein
MIQFRPSMGADFPKPIAPSSNTGWREGWFYLRNDEAHPLPAFTGQTFTSSCPQWREVCADSMRPHVDRTTARLRALRAAGLTEPLIVATWLGGGLVPLRRRALRVFEMAPELAPYEGTVTAPTPSIVEIEAWVAEVTGAPFSFPGDLNSYPRLSSR